jgi:hypothetical protein
LPALFYGLHIGQKLLMIRTKQGRVQEEFNIFQGGSGGEGPVPSKGSHGSSFRNDI